MTRVAPFGAAVLITLATSAVSPAAVRTISAPAPPAQGQWHQLGATVTSRPGEPIHFFRTATYPNSLAVVVTSKSSQLIRVSWWSYCEFESDDGNTEENRQTISGTHRVVAYPPVFDGATRCYVQVNGRAGPHAGVAAAIFAG